MRIPKSLPTIALLLGLSAPALAQTGEAAPAIVEEPATLPPGDGDLTAPDEGMAAHTEMTTPVETATEVPENPVEANPGDFSKEVWAKVQARDWVAVGAGVLMFLIFLLRKFGIRISSWFGTKAGGWSLNFGTAFGLVLALAVWSGAGWSFSLVPIAIGAGLAASGGHEALKDMLAWLFNRERPVTEDAEADPVA